MKKINRTIACQTGIYQTDFRLTMHKDGSVTVRVPYIHWENNSGSLRHENIKVKAGRNAEEVKRFFRLDELADNSGCTLMDALR